jgi:hypothetical protein
VYEGIVPERAASMLNPRPEEEGAENLGGSTRVNGELVFLRLRIPMRFRVGERPAGAERGVDFEIEVSSLGAGERAVRIERWGEVRTGLREDEKSLGEGGALVKKKLTGLRRGSFPVPSGHFERLGERKMIGSMFSQLSSSKAAALRLLGEVRARGVDVRLM